MENNKVVLVLVDGLRPDAVQQCKHHCSNENYCSLNQILVGTHEANPTQDQCTDCKSFRMK